MEIRLDGKEITNREELYEKLQAVLGPKGLIGKNLDALWDVLSDIADVVNIRLINEEELVCNLGDYGEKLLSMLAELKNEKVNLIAE